MHGYRFIYIDGHIIRGLLADPRLGASEFVDRSSAAFDLVPSSFFELIRSIF
jgi:hypothetical protein